MKPPTTSALSSTIQTDAPAKGADLLAPLHGDYALPNGRPDLQQFAGGAARTEAFWLANITRV